MFRTLLTSTAIVALLSTGSLAQTTPAPETPDTDTTAPATENGTSPMDAPADPNNGMTETNNMDTPMVMSEGYSAMEGDNLASRVLGSTVYTSTADDAETIGDISDLVIDANGDIAAVVIGVGGFLGVGEKNVAVDFSELQWTTAADGTWRYVLNTTADALEAAPEFVFEDENAAANDAAGTNNADNSNMAAGAAAGGAAAGAAATNDANAPDTTGTDAMGATDNSGAAGTIDRNSMQDLDETALTAEELQGITVYGTNDEQIGTIGDFVLGEDGKTIDAVIIDVGGFLGIGQKSVAVGFENLDFRTDADNNRYLFLNATSEQLEAQPEFNSETYQTERETQRMVVGG